MEHGIEDHEVRDGNDVSVGFRLVETPVFRIELLLSKSVWLLGGVGRLG